MPSRLARFRWRPADRISTSRTHPPRARRQDPPKNRTIARHRLQAITVAKCFVAWSREGRVRDEAAFACLAGVNPIPASSGNTIRHRLNRGGDRSLNSALYLATVTRMTYDEEIRNYVEKRRAEGKTDREIRRCIKRSLVRRIFRIFSASTMIEESFSFRGLSPPSKCPCRAYKISRTAAGQFC